MLVGQGFHVVEQGIAGLEHRLRTQTVRTTMVGAAEWVVGVLWMFGMGANVTVGVYREQRSV